MFVGITNTPREYAWGSTTAIPELLGTASTGEPQAELWLGTHPGSPSRAIGGADLVEVIGTPLPFLLKLLAAEQPLSLQAHPSAAQAAEGFAREEAAGIPVDAPNRNYRDASPKPELIYALRDGFRALCGFRPVQQSRATIERLIELDAAAPAPSPASMHDWLNRLVDDSSLESVFAWLSSGGDGAAELVASVSGVGTRHPDEFPTIARLAELHPGDPGIAISVLLNEVTLSRGEVLYLPAGNIHAYLEGVGVELMTASDNVLRGGLTPKHVDVPELLSVLDFQPLPVPYLVGERLDANATAFSVPQAGFQLVVFDGPAPFPLVGPAVLVCTSGEFTVTGALGSVSLARGDAVVAGADEGTLQVTGSGQLFLATTA